MNLGEAAGAEKVGMAGMMGSKILLAACFIGLPTCR
jgi:hypothetical protein